MRTPLHGTSPFLSQLVASPCCLPSWELEPLLEAAGKLGFTKLEAFTEWAVSRLDWREDPARVRQLAKDYGFAIVSMHLPMIREEAAEEGLKTAVAAASYAEAIGAGVVLFKAQSKSLFGRLAPRFLDELEGNQQKVVPVLQNHMGSAISTLEDYREVFDAIGNDLRMKAVLEVGHFRRAGVDWRAGWDLLGDRVALIHVNDIHNGASVPFGQGETDFSGLLKHIRTTGYAGDVVVELELSDHETNPQATLDGLRDAVDLLLQLHNPVSS